MAQSILWGLRCAVRGATWLALALGTVAVAPAFGASYTDEERGPEQARVETGGWAFAKPSAALETRNRWGPRGDHLVIALGFSTGQGLAFPNRGLFGSSWDFAAQAVSWETGAEGAYVDAADAQDTMVGVPIEGPLVGAAPLVIARGSLLLRFALPALNDETAARSLFNSGATPGTAGALTIFRPAGAAYVQFRLGDPTGGTRDTYRFTYAPGAAHTALLTWGEQGFRVWVDGLPAPPANPERPLSTAAVVVPIGQRFRLNTNQNQQSSSYARYYAFAVWDWQLEAIERDELFTDPYLPLRPTPRVRFSTWNNAAAFRVKPDEATFNVVAAAGSTGVFRVALSQDAYLRSGVVYSEERSFAATTRQRVESVAALPAPGRWYWIAEYRTDAGATWQPFPGGRGMLRTPRNDPRALVLADDHVCNNQQNISAGDEGYATNDDYGYGMDLVRVTAGASAYKVYAAWKTLYDAYLRADGAEYDLIVHLGDAQIGESASSSETCATRHEVWRNFWAPVLKLGTVVFVLGNHEGEAGYQQNGGEAPRQMWDTYWRKQYLSLPASATYPEGGEGGAWDSAADWRPTGTSDDGVTWDYDDPAYIATYIEALGPEAYTDLQNFYAFTWGNALFVVLDVFRYTEPGDPAVWLGGGSRTRPGPTWTLGLTQRAWLETVLSGSSAPYKFLLLHHLPGGEQIHQPTKWYGRGSGANLTPHVVDADATSPYYGHVWDPEDWWLHQLCKTHGVTAVIKGHDHKFCHVVKETVHYVSAPTAAAPSLNTDGWNFPSAAASYGSASILGADKAEVLRLHNCYGYLEMTLDAGARITLRNTAAALAPLNWTVVQHTEQWISPPLPVTEGRVVLSEVPRDIAYVTAQPYDFAHPPANSYSDTWPTYVPPFEGTAQEEPFGVPDLPVSGTQVFVAHFPRTLYSAVLPTHAGPLGDADCDGRVTFADIDPFVAALYGPAAYYAQLPHCNWLLADTNCDGNVTFADIETFVSCLGGACRCP